MSAKHGKSHQHEDTRIMVDELSRELRIYKGYAHNIHGICASGCASCTHLGEEPAAPNAVRIGPFTVYTYWMLPDVALLIGDC